MTLYIVVADLQRIEDAVFLGRVLLNAGRICMTDDLDPKRARVKCWLNAIRESSQRAADSIMEHVNNNSGIQAELGR